MSDSWLEKLNGKLIRWMHLSCQQTSPLISESLDHPLSVSQKMRLKFHLMMCGVCQCYLAQLKTLSGLAQRLGKVDNGLLESTQLRPEFKIQLKKNLKS